MEECGITVEPDAWRRTGVSKRRVLEPAEVTRTQRGGRRFACFREQRFQAGNDDPKAQEWRVPTVFAQEESQDGKRRNLGTFKSRSAAEKHERAVQFFKRA